LYQASLFRLNNSAQHYNSTAAGGHSWFAFLLTQVTNPPIDPLREKLVTSTRAMIGPEGDVTDMGHEGHAARLELIQPFLKPEELQAFKHMDYRGWRAKVCHLHTDKGN